MSAAATPERGGDARAIGAIAGLIGSNLTRKARMMHRGGDNPRSGQPVWRNSYYEGTKEHQIWRPYGDGKARTGKRLTAIVMRAAKGFERESRARRQKEVQGRRRGLIGEVGVAVLEFLWETVDYLTGRLDPAIGTIAAELGRSYSAVHAALTALRKHGFLQWQRRSRPIENPVPGGPLVEQISNAYVLLIPKAARNFVDVVMGKAPPPDCVAWDAEQRKAEFGRMLAGLTAGEFHRDFWSGDTRRGETLANIARMVDERESSKTRETGGVLRTP